MLLGQSAPAPAAPAGAVRVVTIEGDAVAGAWAGVNEAGAILLERGGKTTGLPVDKLMLLRWPASGPASAPTAPSTVVWLTDGSRLHARIVEGDARYLKIETATTGELEVPLTRLAAVQFAHAEHGGARAAFDEALATRDRSQDVLVMIRDDRVAVLRGVTESLAPDGGAFKWRNRSVAIDPAKVYGLVLAAGVQQPPIPPVMCQVRDGSIWGGRLTGGSASEVRLRLTDGRPITLRVADLTEIRFRSDRVVFLSDVEPADYAFEPFAATRWPYRVNKSVANRPMRIGDQVFERGIGMHSKATLTYALPDGFTHLAAVIGIDEAVGSLGSVIFRVVADDKQVFESGPVTGRDEPRPILVPIGGARELKLVVDFGDDLDVGDQANWGNVRLLK